MTLHEQGNGSAYCEPYSGVSSCTDMSISDINDLEYRVVKLKKESEDQKANSELTGSLTMMERNGWDEERN